MNKEQKNKKAVGDDLEKNNKKNGQNKVLKVK